MDFIFEETEVIRVKEEQADADTSTQSQIQIDRIPDLKLHGNLECGVTLEGMQNIASEMPSMESHVRRMTFSGPQMDCGQDKTNQRSEHVVGFIRDPARTLTPSLDDEIDIKYEGNWIENNLTSNAERDSDIVSGPDSIPSNTNPKSGSQCPVISEHIELNEFYLRLLQLQCEQDCDTCRKYVRKLSEHIRATHSEGQQIRDPLLVDPLAMDQTSDIGIKCEVVGDTDTVRMECSEESDSNCESEEENKSDSDPYYNATGDSDSEVGNVGDSDPDYYTPSNSNRKSKSGQKIDMDDKLDKSCRKNEMVSGTKFPNKETRFKCQECGKGFTKPCHLTIHTRVHTGERPYNCEECGTSYIASSCLVRHMQTHTGVRPYTCEDCGTGFTQSSNLQRHRNAHRFKCEECGESFTRNGALTTHMRIHTGGRLFKCSECAKSFSANRDLNVHMRIHTGERPYKCEECGKGFITNYKLGRHRKTHKKKT